MKVDAKTRKNESGFSLIELIVTIVILGILASIAIPGFAAWLPEYRLKRAARDVYSNLQKAKLGAIKANETWGAFFDAGNSRYSIWSLGTDGAWGGGDDQQQGPAIDLSNYVGVNFGNGNAPSGIDGVVFGPAVTYPGNPVAVFTCRGTVSNRGYVYLSNSKGTCYGVGTPSPSGVVVLKKYMGAADGWE